MSDSQTKQRGTIVARQSPAIASIPRKSFAWPTSRPALICMLCGRQEGEVVDGRAVHHAGCSREMPNQGRMIRCCACGGSLMVEDPSI